MDFSTRQAQLDRRLSQRSLYYLCKEVLGYKDMVPHVHGEFCSFATHPRFGRFRQATIPRSWFKTWVLTVGKSIWLTLPDEEGLYKAIFPYKGADVRILIASNVIDNAARMIHKIKQEWMQNDRLRAAFPELIPDFNKIRWSDHSAEVNRTLKSTEATYTAVGVGGSVISQHFDHIIEDDLIYARKDDFTGMELMPSQEDIDNAIGWHKLSFSLLANPGVGCLDNVGTRWAPKDLIYFIKMFEKQYRCFEMSVEKADGTPLWPERYSREVLEQIRAAQGNRIYETQYLNRPRAMEDIVFKKEYVNIHQSFKDEYPQGLNWKTIVDVSGWGDSKGIARGVVLTGARDEKNHIWIGRLDVGRMNPTEVITTYVQHGLQFNSKVYVEEVQYQRAIRHFAKQYMEQTGKFVTQEQLPFDGRQGAKDLRIRSTEPIINAGGLHILRSMEDLLEELEFYPHARTVDILDCLGYLLKVAKPALRSPVQNTVNPLSMESIEKELKSRKSNGYPFDFQLPLYQRNMYGRHSLN